MGRIPLGCTRCREAIDAIGRELFGADWTGEEDKVPVFQYPPGETLPGMYKKGEERRRMPDTAEYRAEFESNERSRSRYQTAVREVLNRVEAGILIGVVVDPWTGQKHNLNARWANRSDAERLLKKGSAPIPNSRNSGNLYIAGLPDAPKPATITAAPAPSVNSVLDYVLIIADGATPIPDLRRMAEQHFACRIPEKSIWRDVLRQLPADKKLSRGRPK